MRYVVIMAGGSGTRLWPLSKKGTPKQLLPLIGGKSLLRLAYERALTVVPPERVLVVTGASYLDEVAEILPEVPAENLLGEPVGRDSLNAAAWPAAVLAARDPDAVIAQLTADHLIEPAQAFADSLRTAFELAEGPGPALVTLGVVPTSAHTGYGYLHRGEPVAGHPECCRVAEFVEKPALELAEKYLAGGEFWWNSGMFCWKAGVLLEQVKLLHPQNYELVQALAAEPGRLGELFVRLPKISVDYAIMEPAAAGLGSAQVLAVPLQADWRDVGGYASLGEALPHDGSGNVIQGLARTLDARQNVVYNSDEGSIVAVIGVEGLVVVRTADATLVVPVEQSEQVKKLVAEVAAEHPEFS
jgi:mannose-1-phosphate guanylyltransferase